MTTRTADDLAAIVATVLDLPLHRSLGLRLTVPGDPASGLVVEVDEGNSNPGRVLHGGVTALLLDVSAFLALLPQLPVDRHAVTVSSSLSILSAVPLGTQVTTLATVQRLGRSQAFVTAEARTERGLVATGQIVKAVVPV